MNDKKISCSKCDYQFENKPDFDNNTPCPKCGATTKSIEDSLVGEGKGYASFRGQKIKVDLPKRKKLRWDLFIGYEHSVRRGEMVYKERLVDKDQNLYREKIVDPETGEIIHECVEQLSDHIGRGSAKDKKR